MTVSELFKLIMIPIMLFGIVFILSMFFLPEGRLMRFLKKSELAQTLAGIALLITALGAVIAVFGG